MTGFGTAEGRLSSGTGRVEIRSVNHRYLSVTIKASAEFAPLEPDIRDRLRREFERGHLTVTVRFAEHDPARSDASVRVDFERARAIAARLRDLKAAADVAGDVTLDLLARQPDVFVVGDRDGVSAEWDELEPVVVSAAAECRAMRAREGAVLADELTGLLDRLAALREQVVGLAPGRLTRERDRLRAQVGELLDGRPVDDGRLMQELAFLADRLDLTEELVRLDAHLGAGRARLAADGAVGKQLGFLAQEIGREINTIGSKANDAEIQHLVVEMKGELERFREQIENLE